MSKTDQISHPDIPTFNMVHIEGGTLLIEGKTKITIPTFYLAEHQTTQALYKAVMNGKNPSNFKGDQRPVEMVSWDEAKGFIKVLNIKTGKTFRLPSETEWEYAAKGGIYSQGYDFCGSDKLKQVGWYDENNNGETHNVGLKLANELGLHDMSGNVWEWCEDHYHRDFENTPKDGSAWIDTPDRGGHRVLRGGSYLNSAVSCRPTYRVSSSPDDRINSDGFRLCLSPQFTL